MYLASDYGEMAPERKFLERYVFPALTVKCLSLRVHFKFANLSQSFEGGKEEVAGPATLAPPRRPRPRRCCGCCIAVGFAAHAQFWCARAACTAL